MDPMQPIQSIRPNEPAKPKPNWRLPVTIVLIVLVTAGIVGGTTWFMMDQNQKNTKSKNDKSITALQNQISELKKTETIAPTATTTGTTPAVADWRTYTNSDYGFNLTFGDKWSGYTVTKSTPSGTELANYAFELPSNDGNFISQTKTTFPVFNVKVYNTADFQAIDRSHPTPSLPTAISSSNGKTFAYVMSTQWPSDWKLSGGTNGDVQTVTSTFKFD